MIHQYGLRLAIVAILIVAVASSASLARELAPQLPSAPESQPAIEQQLSIDQAMQLALRNNLSISIERTNVQISRADITFAQGDFDPTLFSAPSLLRTVSPTSSRLSNVGATAPSTFIEEEHQDINIGVRKRLSPGTSVSLEFRNNRLESSQGFRSLFPQYTPEIDLRLTQPLLRDFGRKVTLNRITVARTNRDISKERFRERVIDIVGQARDKYWDLVFAIGDLDVRRQSLRLAQELVQINKAQVEVGTLAPIEILQAQTRAAQREEDVILGEKDVADEMDRLRRVLNIFKSPVVRGMRIVPTDRPTFTEMAIDLDEQIELALKNQPSLTQRRLDLKNQRLNVKVARNRLLPSVNFETTLGLNGLAGSPKSGGTTFDGGFSDALDTMFSGDFYTLRLALNFEYPLGNRTARGQATRARLELARALIELRDQEQEIIQQVNEGVRRITTSSKRIASTRIAARLAAEQLEAEQKKFAVGLSTSFNVLEFQEDLADARRNDLRANVDFNKSLVNLDRLTGAILDKHNISLDLE